MSVLRNGSKGARFAPFGFLLCLLTVAPTEIGYQDLASLLARQPGVAERWQEYMFASSRRMLQVASFNLPRPIGTQTRDTPTYRLASLDGAGVDVTGSLGRDPLGPVLRPWKKSDFPKVVRSSKSDRLPLYTPEVAAPAAAPQRPEPNQPNSNASVRGAKTVDAAPVSAAPLDAELEAALNAPRLPQYEPSVSLQDIPADHPLNAKPSVSNEDSAAAETAPDRDGFSFQTATLYFGNSSLGVSSGALERWQPGEEPVIVMPGLDPDMKMPAAARPSDESSLPSAGGESVASKGEVTGESQRPRTPAERLGLDAKTRAKSEKCLTDAIYFEARGEAVRGQIAVAQVVLNRAFSGYYPTTVCGVVYQNSHRHLSCQFTFACDGIRDVVKEPDMWERAKKIAKESLDGRLWLPEVGKSTHYHAYWVRPSWVNEMKKMYKYGVHTFYRPRAWGDGKDAPTWGSPEETAKISAKLAEAAKSSAEISDATVRR
ncbi:cell wall hydrolase SleB [Bradyrhizobiaceae bacterium SG-6C]|nr:cell wall hydrolase SleB [Bradyrhizobiaceae bacterium SG-6C]